MHVFNHLFLMLHLPAPSLAIGYLVSAICGGMAAVLLLRLTHCRRRCRIVTVIAAASLSVCLFWILLVPRLQFDTAQVLVGGQVQATMRNGQMNYVELGQRIRLRVDVTTGMLPMDTITAYLPSEHHHETSAIKFHAVGGKGTYESEEYAVPMLGKYPDAGGEIRDITVILRNKWGIENMVILPLRVLPESESRRTA